MELPSAVIDLTNLIKPNLSLGTHDRPYWARNKNGLFTTKSVYRILSMPSSHPYDFGWVWKINTLCKINFFLWLCSHNRLPTSSYLHYIGLSQDPTCPVCGLQPETITHIFTQCYVAQKFWLDMGLNLSNVDVYGTCWLNILKSLSPPDNSNTWLTLLSFAIWHIWINRNNNVFNKKFDFPNAALVHDKSDEYVNTISSHSNGIGYVSINIRWCPPPSGIFKLKH